MDGEEALRALANAVEDADLKWPVDPNRAGMLMVKLEHIRAALSKSDQAPREAVDHCAHGKIRAPYCAECAREIAERADMNVFPDMNAMAAEFKRLRAWEKWAREVAVPALKWYGSSSHALEALAVMPKNAP